VGLMSELRRGPWSPDSLGLPDLDRVRRAVATRLKRWRKLAGMSEVIVSGLLKISAEDLHKIESGLAPVTLDQVVVLAHVYGVSCAEMVDEEIPKSERGLQAALSLAREIMALPEDVRDDCIRLVKAASKGLASD